MAVHCSPLQPHISCPGARTEVDRSPPEEVASYAGGHREGILLAHSSVNPPHARSTERVTRKWQF